MSARGPRISEARIAALRDRTDLVGLIGRKVRLTRRGRELVGLCPFHDERTPSFTVPDGKQFYHCFGCGAHGDAIAWLMAIEKLDFLEAVKALDPSLVSEAARESTEADVELERQVAKARTERQREAERRRSSFRELARALWHESLPIGSTPGEGYFRGRGIRIPLPPTLRYHPNVVFGPRGSRITLPAVVAGVQDPEGHVCACHRIFLDPGSIAAGRPRKARIAQEKALLGSPAGGAVRLAAAARSMATDEGIETALAVLQAIPDLALWCGIDGEHMAQIVWPDIVRDLLVLADRDPVVTKRGNMQGKRPGEVYARKTAGAFIARGNGRTARIAVPPGRKADFNDLLLAG